MDYFHRKYLALLNILFILSVLISNHHSLAYELAFKNGLQISSTWDGHKNCNLQFSFILTYDLPTSFNDSKFSIVPTGTTLYNTKIVKNSVSNTNIGLIDFYADANVTSDDSNLLLNFREEITGLAGIYDVAYTCKAPQIALPELINARLSPTNDYIATFKIQKGIRYTFTFYTGKDKQSYSLSALDGYGSTQGTLTLSLLPSAQNSYNTVIRLSCVSNNLVLGDVYIPPPFNTPTTTKIVNTYAPKPNVTKSNALYDNLAMFIEATNVNSLILSMTTDSFSTSTAQKVGNDLYYLVNPASSPDTYDIQPFIVGYTNEPFTKTTKFILSGFVTNTTVSIFGPIIRQTPDEFKVLLNSKIENLSTNLIYVAKEIRSASISTPPYPVGFKSGNASSLVYSIPQVSTIYVARVSASVSVENQSAMIFADTGSGTIDVTEPFIQSFTVTPFDYEYIIIQVTVQDDLSGFYTLTQDSPFPFSIGASDLMHGDMKVGTYEKIIKVPTDCKGSSFSLTVADMANNKRLYKTDSFTGDFKIIPPIPYGVNFTIDNIKSFRFKQNSLDVTDVFLDSSVYFTLDNNMVDFKPKFSIQLPRVGIDPPQKKTFTGYWNPSINQYQIDFSIPMNYIDGEIYYYLESNPSITRDMLQYQFGYSAVLNIVSKKIDYLPPFIMKIDTSNIYWNITISDPINGLKRANFSVISDLELLPFTFSFTSADAIVGDQYNGLYQIRVPFLRSTCINQKYKLNGIILEDNGGNIAEYNNVKNQFDPLLYISTDKVNPLYIQISNCASVPDISEPNITLDSISQGPEYFLAKFTAYSPVGISERHVPYVVLTTFNNHIMKEATVIFINGTHTSYSAEINVPSDFGYPTLTYIPSIVGVVSNHLQYSSLFEITYVYKSFFELKLKLEKASQVNESGGLVTVYGKSFGGNPQEIQGYSSSGNIGNPIYATETVLIINLPPFGARDYIDFYIDVSGNKSNSLRITPQRTTPVTPTPTPTLTTCPGSPQCSNNGQCNQGKCECNSGWIGPSCSLKPLDVITNVDPEKPVTTISGKDNLLNSFIQIASLYELDQNKNIIQQYDLKDKWSFENQTTPDSTIYIFSRLLSSNRTTRINITLQYFDKDSIYSFGNQNFTMNKSSMKYSIILGSYQFGNQLNTLQLVMNATLSTKDSNGCIRSDFSSDSDSSVEYLKVQINENTLFARFINFGIFDFRVKSLTNQLLNKTSESRGSISTSLIGINIPYYEMSALLDPDFSVLVDQNADVCSSKSGLTTAQIIGIAVGGAVFLIFASIIIILLIKRRYSIHFKKGINMVKLEATKK